MNPSSTDAQPFNPAGFLDGLLEAKRQERAAATREGADAEWDAMVNGVLEKEEARFMSLAQLTLGVLETQAFHDSLVKAMEEGVQQEFLEGFVASFSNMKDEGDDMIETGLRAATVGSRHAFLEIKRIMASATAMAQFGPMSLCAQLRSAGVDKPLAPVVAAFIQDLRTDIARSLVASRREVDAALRGIRKMGVLYRRAVEGCLSKDDLKHLEKAIVSIPCEEPPSASRRVASHVCRAFPSLSPSPANESPPPAARSAAPGP